MNINMENQPEKTYVLTVKANDGRAFTYVVDPSGMLANYSSISTDVNRKPIEGDLKKINKNIIERMISDEKIVYELDKTSWNYKMMDGKYVDNNGIFYYNIKSKLYPYIYHSKYLSKHFNEI